MEAETLSWTVHFGCDQDYIIEILNDLVSEEKLLSYTFEEVDVPEQHREKFGDTMVKYTILYKNVMGIYEFGTRQASYWRPFQF